MWYCIVLHTHWHTQAPAHELSRYILLINKMCREAVVERDPIVDSMWILLSELIDAHNRLPRDCIFKYATKPSTRNTALAFMQLVPMFALRLKQRDFDYLLVKPKLKR